MLQMKLISLTIVLWPFFFLFFYQDCNFLSQHHLQHLWLVHSEGPGRQALPSWTGFALSSGPFRMTTFDIWMSWSENRSCQEKSCKHNVLVLIRKLNPMRFWFSFSYCLCIFHHCFIKRIHLTFLMHQEK